MRGSCKCGRLLDHRFGDGDVCASCRESAEDLDLGRFARNDSPRPGEIWEPVAGRIGGVGFGTERSET